MRQVRHAPDKIQKRTGMSNNKKEGIPINQLKKRRGKSELFVNKTKSNLNLTCIRLDSYYLDVVESLNSCGLLFLCGRWVNCFWFSFKKILFLVFLSLLALFLLFHSFGFVLLSFLFSCCTIINE